MIDEILELGFDTIELSHGMTVAKLPGIRRAHADGRFTCVGVHNYFPSPVEVMIDAPDAYEFSSYRAADRRRALDMTRRSLELAGEFDARYLVLHMGSAPLDPGRWTRPLTERVAAGEGASPAFAKRRIQFVRKRERVGRAGYRRAIAALETLAPEAEKAGVILAVESRSRFEDVPTEREMVALQQHFADNPWVRYWHDFGHVQLKHNLGLLDHAEWLDRIAPHLLGAHVHDVEWPARDHRVPFAGELDFAALLRRFPADAPLVWELSPGRPADQIRAALPRWRELLAAREAASRPTSSSPSA